MLSWNRKKGGLQNPTARVGIAVGREMLTLAAINGEVDGLPHIAAWHSAPYRSVAEIAVEIAEFVERHGLSGQPCRCVLSPDHYSLRLVERPANVPDDELVDATRWLIRDLIEFDIEFAALAILPVPESGARARVPSMFVVASDPEPARELGVAITSGGLLLEGFDVAETAMLSLNARMGEVASGGGVLQFDEKASILTVSHEQNLFLARNLNIDLDELDRAAEQALGAEDPSAPSVIESIDPLLLDIQRSFDYYESEYGRAPVSRLTLLPGSFDVTPLVPALSEALRPIQIESFELSREYSFEDTPPSELQPALSLALGAAFASPDLIGDALIPLGVIKGEPGFGLGNLIRITAMMATLLGLYCGFSSYQLNQKSERLTALEAERESISAEIGMEVALLEQSEAETDPQTILDKLALRRDAQLSTLREMTQRASQTDTSFSRLLTALARQDVRNLWLTRIEFSSGGDVISLEGRTLNPAQLPTYLRQLGTEPGFDQRTFQHFEVERGDQAEAGLLFRIATLETTTDEAERGR